jgi:hypothetical protein
MSPTSADVVVISSAFFGSNVITTTTPTTTARPTAVAPMAFAFFGSTMLIVFGCVFGFWDKGVPKEKMFECL